MYAMGWLRLVGSIKLRVSFAKESYKRDDILQKRPIILSILVVEATPYTHTRTHVPGSVECRICGSLWLSMGWLRLVGSNKSQVSSAKETYKRDNILQKRPMI